MAKAKKATKKFVKNRLKSTLQERKRRKKVKEIFGAKSGKKQQAGTASSSRRHGSDHDADSRVAKIRGKNTGRAREATKIRETFKDMDVDSFLTGGFNAALGSDAENSDEAMDAQDDQAGSETDEDTPGDAPTEEDGDEAEGSLSSNVEDEDGRVDEDGDEDDISRHKKELRNLKKLDPDFYEYLQENDKELLQFDFSDAEDEDESDVDGENVAVAEGELDLVKKGARSKEAVNSSREVTEEMLNRWQANLVECNSVKSLKRLLLAFGCAARAKDAELEKGKSNKEPVYVINDSSVFNKIILVAMNCAIPVFDYHLPVKKPSDSKKQPALPSSHPRWKNMQTAVRSFLGNMLHIMRQVTDSTMLSFMIKSADGAMPYFSCFPKLGRIFVKTLLHLWSTAEDRVRIGAFLSMMHFAKLCPNPYLDLILKGLYMTLIQACRQTNAYTLPTIQLLMNCMVELYGVDLQASYQHAFVYIRQLAIHLRSAMTTTTKESFKVVYNWQYIHCLRFWARVISVYAQDGKGPLDPLLYPLVQISMGVVRLIPTAKYFPLRFLVVRSLIGLIKATHVFIPLAPTLLEVFDTEEMKRNPKPSTLKPLNFELHIRAPNHFMHTRAYQDGVTEQVTELFLEYATAYAKSVAFPELMTPALALLKRHEKLAGKSRRFAKQLQQTIDKVKQNSDFIVSRRAKLNNVSPASMLSSSPTSVLPSLEDPSVVTPLQAYFNAVNAIKGQREATLRGVCES